MPNDPAEWREQQEGVDIIDDHSDPVILLDDEKERYERDEEHAKIRQTIDEEVGKIMENKGYPAFGESRVWINPNMPEKTPDDPSHPSVKIASFNIERGYKLEQQIKYLREENADIVAIQEADWGNERTGNRNIALDLAAGAGYKYVVFSAQVTVLKSGKEFPKSIRKLTKSFGGEGGGVQGIAILSKYPIKGVKCIRLPSFSARGKMSDERLPEKGGRVAQKATIQIGDRKINMYNTHLAHVEGMDMRLVQWDKIAEDADKDENPTVICGDFNTIRNKLGKLLFRGGGNFHRMRQGTFKDESSYWNENEFDENSMHEKRYANAVDSRTLPDAIMGGQLDYILLEKGKIREKKAKVGPKELSDHSPVVVEAQL